jgi:hypothetical protein
MHILYVDESGDPGIHRYGSPYFILSGLIVPEDEWLNYLDRLKDQKNRQDQNSPGILPANSKYDPLGIVRK